ncbi:MAG TPA: peptide deformylase [Patescibacteria group bacterium]|nr:peptide deformylase [Patescibacteria group bacterium]
MAVMKIVLDGDPVLRARAAEVDPKEIATPAFKTLLDDMVETMYAANGVGIAAPQVGVGKRIFIAESAQGPIALINPVFTKTSWKLMGGEEGCLSVPGKFDKVRRHKTVTIEGLTAEGKKVTFTAENFFARILQHELDHLDGKLYVDRVKEQKAGKK